MSPIQRMAFDQLRQARWFGGLPPGLQEAMIEAGFVRRYARGEALMREGQAASAVHAVVDGQVRLTRRYSESGETVVHVTGPGAWFGMNTLLPGGIHELTALADGRVQALVIPGPELLRIVEREPRWLRPFLELELMICGRLFRYIGELPGLTPDALLRIRIADLAELARGDRRIDGPVELRISQADLASMTGMSRQRLNLRLQAMQAAGLVEIGFRRIVVPDETRLRESARGLSDAAARDAA